MRFLLDRRHRRSGTSNPQPYWSHSFALQGRTPGRASTWFCAHDSQRKSISGSSGPNATSTRLPDGTVTAEVARRQGDGTWLWVIDRFSVA
ncbi:MAG: hypothetical protein E5W98_00035 [Mesorhizobium sp.]|nr:MAG: hypothetical protein E5W98_00035 [Mesorhizobium sp.]